MRDARPARYLRCIAAIGIVHKGEDRGEILRLSPGNRDRSVAMRGQADRECSRRDRAPMVGAPPSNDRGALHVQSPGIRANGVSRRHWDTIIVREYISMFGSIRMSDSAVDTA